MYLPDMTGVMLKHGVGKGTGVRLYKITLSLSFNI